MSMKKTISLLLMGVFFMTWFFGCKKDSNNSVSSQQLISLTLETIKDLNEKSNFGDFAILDPVPPGSLIPGTNDMNDSEDCFDCYSYDSVQCITLIELSSLNTSVYGLSNGQKASETDSVMIQEGFSKISEDEANGYFSNREKTVAYRKYHVTIAFAITKDSDPTIKKILVSVVDPSYDQPVY